MLISQFLLAFGNFLILVCTSGLLFLSFILFVECIAACLSVAPYQSKYKEQNQNKQDTKLTVLVPAHNEETVIRSTLLSLKEQLKNDDELVVVADNCTDQTAEIAGAVGATVIERHDDNLRGKGYALDYGLRYIESRSPSVVVFVDADCEVARGAIEQLSQMAIATQRPVQATYLMEKPKSSSPKESVSAFAFKVKNLVRPYGLNQLKMPCLLTGTGMAFPMDIIRAVNLANGSIVEDMKLGFDLSIAGYPPLFCPQANITGILPSQVQASKSQRTRWEHGHLQTLLTYVPKLLKAGIQQHRFDLFVSAIDLCIPPLSLLVVFWSLLMVLSLLAAVLGSWMPLTIASAAGCLLIIAILSAWNKFGRSDLPLMELLTIPLYILFKIPIYFKFLVQPQNSWIRTERDS
ncbi:MAG: glycosyltransferase family 2 protein [Nostocales cyanobacterium 94392]|nr:glycosyltransferase family 2 protein [Nostocales cyanobacterium 94392]